MIPGRQSVPLSTLPQSPDCSDSWGFLAEMDLSQGRTGSFRALALTPVLSLRPKGGGQAPPEF